MGQDISALRRLIKAEIGLQFPFIEMIPMTRGLWKVSHVNESASIMDSSGQARTLSASGSSISFDAASTDTSSDDRQSATVSHTASGTNRGALVFAGHADADVRDITGITYGGVAMVAEEAQTKTFAGGEVVVEVFSIIAPATGAQDVVVTWDADVIASWVAVVSYNGVNQTDLVDATGTNTGVSNTPSAQVTTNTNNSFIVGGYTFFGGDGDPSTPGDTERWDLATGTAVASDVTSAGGDLLQATAGAGTVNMTANASDDWAMVGVEMKAADGAFGVDDYMPYAVLDGSSYWSRADEAGLDITNGLTMGGWFYFDATASAIEFMMGKWTETGNVRSYGLRRDASGNIEALVSSNGTAETSQTSTNTVAANTWVFAVLRYDPSTTLDVLIGKDGGAGGALEEDNNTSSIPSSINSAGADLSFGARDTSGTAAAFLTGRYGGFGFLSNAVLTDDHLNQLYAQTRRLIDV